ncbi:hypothetical protein N7510_001773 [Penicillium lagena]|uniref:uncharacterized protein n=1 Tax=Penicillium lagena TaxID=94218 RepID=UPI0025413DF2|nr:uncharacterized protein N7510_001773 [Penicillium lagena]KAJ5625464.1 hypothetical protein N7510_001773 [Penicillium lagena]
MRLVMALAESAPPFPSGINNTIWPTQQLSPSAGPADMYGDDFAVSQLAIPAVSVLISFLAYTSQYFFLHFESAPLQKDEAWKINIFALCIWICYFRACYTDPGRLPRESAGQKPDGGSAHSRQRWCRSLLGTNFSVDAFLKWTTIVHGQTTVCRISLSLTLLAFYSMRWSYLGPSIVQLGHLAILFIVNSMTVFALFVLLVRTVWSLGSNTTTIESWEIERHATLIRRARVLGGYLDGPGGVRIHIKQQEFPYDIGIWANIKQGMGGSSNFISWFWPLAFTPNRSSGWDFEVNGFESPGVSWPPPDPDRIPLPTSAKQEPQMPQIYASAREEVEAFQRRQSEDMKRQRPSEGVQRRKRFYDRYKELKDDEEEREVSPERASAIASDEGEESWRNSEGERLRDFGVDEDVEFYDEEDIPLAVLIEQRKQRKQ